MSMSLGVGCTHASRSSSGPRQPWMSPIARTRMTVSGMPRQYNNDMPIILFDIDGTLVRTGGAGKLAMESALVAAFGVTELRDEVPYSGRTDVAIAFDLLRVHGIEPTPANQQKLRDTYL